MTDKHRLFLIAARDRAARARERWDPEEDAWQPMSYARSRTQERAAHRNIARDSNNSIGTFATGSGVRPTLQRFDGARRLSVGHTSGRTWRA